MTVVTVYGDETDLSSVAGNTTTSTGHSFDAVPVKGWEQVPGHALFFGTATANGRIVIAPLTLVGSQLFPTSRQLAFYEFDPESRWFRRVYVPTNADHYTARIPSAPQVGIGDMGDFVQIDDDTIVGCVFWPYSQWNIARFGQFPTIVTLTRGDKGAWEYDPANSWTSDDLAAASAEGATTFVSATSGTGETYKFSPGVNECDVFPDSGHVVFTYYFRRNNPTATPGTDGSGGCFVYNPALGEVVATYEWPTYDGLVIAPRQVQCDPTGTVGDERFVVIFDSFFTAGGSARKAIVELSYDNTPGTITALTDPMLPRGEHHEMGSATFNTDGDCLVAYIDYSLTPTFDGFNSEGIAVFTNSGGDRSWLAQAPETGDIYGVAVDPDVMLGAAGGANANPWSIGQTAAGDVACVSLTGRVRAFTPDSPLVARANEVSNPTFASNVTGWESFFATSIVTWDSGNSGRCKVEGINPNPDSVTLLRSTPAALGIAEAQSVWVTAHVESGTATEREARVGIRFLDGSNNHVSFTPGPYITVPVGEEIRLWCAAEVPAGTTNYQVEVWWNYSQSSGEYHYVNTAHMSEGPALHADVIDCDLNDLEKDGGGVTARPIGMDPYDRMWVSITNCDGGDAGGPWPNEPYNIPQYLVAIEMSEVL